MNNIGHTQSHTQKKPQSIMEQSLQNQQTLPQHQPQLSSKSSNNQQILNQKTYKNSIRNESQKIAFLVNTKNNQTIKDSFYQACASYWENGGQELIFVNMYEDDVEEAIKFCNDHLIDGESIKVFILESKIGDVLPSRYVLTDCATQENILQFFQNYKNYKKPQKQYMTRKTILKLTYVNRKFLQETRYKIYLFNKVKDQQLSNDYKDAVEQFKKNSKETQQMIFLKFGNDKIEKDMADRLFIDDELCTVVLYQSEHNKQRKYILNKSHPTKQKIIQFLQNFKNYQIPQFTTYITTRIQNINQLNYEHMKKFKYGLYLFNDGESYDLYSQWISAKNLYQKAGGNEVVFVMFGDPEGFQLIAENFGVDWKQYPVFYLERQVGYREGYFYSDKKFKYAFKSSVTTQQISQYLLKKEKKQVKICEQLKKDPIKLINYQSEASKIFQNEDNLIFIMFNLEDSEQLHQYFCIAAKKYTYPEQRPVIFCEVRKQIRQIKQFCTKYSIEHKNQLFLVFDMREDKVKIMKNQITKQNLIDFISSYPKQQQKSPQLKQDIVNNQQMTTIAKQ